MSGFGTIHEQLNSLFKNICELFEASWCPTFDGTFQEPIQWLALLNSATPELIYPYGDESKGYI